MTKEMIAKYMKEINRNPILFKDIENPSYELCKEAVKREPVLIKFIDNPTEEICEIAIRKRPYALFHIKNPSKKACILAVKKNGYAIELIDNPDEDICIEAINKEANAIAFIQQQTYKLAQLAIKKDGSTLRHIRKGILSEDEHFIKEFKDIVFYINNIEEKWLFSCISINKKFASVNNLDINGMKATLNKYKTYIDDYKEILKFINIYKN